MKFLLAQLVSVSKWCKMSGLAEALHLIVILEIQEQNILTLTLQLHHLQYALLVVIINGLRFSHLILSHMQAPMPHQQV